MKDLTSGNIHKNFLLFSLPIIASSFLSTAFGIVDTSIAGLFLGAKGLAALGATTAFFLLGESIFFGLAYGVSVVIANLFGGQHYFRLKSIFYSNLWLTAGACTGMAMVFIPLWQPIFSFLNVDPLITAEARDYYFCLCLHMLPALVNHYCNMCSNAIGETTFPLFTSTIGAILNLGGNLLAVAVLDLGVLGLGLATLLSSSVVLVMNLIRFRGYFKKMGVGQMRYCFRWRHITSIISYALPNIFQQSSMYVAGLLMSPIKNALGYAAVATLAITSRLQSMNATIYYASARTAGNYAAQCVGAKKYRKIRSAIGVAMLQACLFFLPILLLICFFPHVVCRIFIDEASEPSVTAHVLEYIRYFLPFIVLNMVCAVFHSIFRGIKANRHLIISTSISATVQLIAAYFLAPLLGLTGLFISAVLAWIAESIYILIVYLSGLWVPRDIRAEVLQSKARPQETISLSR